MPLKEDLRVYEEYIVKMHSKNTVRAYLNDLDDFIVFAESKGFKDTSEIDHFMIREYLTVLRGEITRSSMNRKLSGIKSFFKYLKMRGIVDLDPASRVMAGKNIMKYPDVLNQKEVEKLLDFEFGADKLSVRDGALLEFLYSTGCRVQEAAMINRSDIDLFSGTATVTGKGRKERIVPLGKIAIRRLNSYLNTRDMENWGRGNLAVFITVSGKRISERTIRRIVKKYTLLTGINKNVGPHTLRHSFATHMLESGCNLRTVQELLGHSRLQTTQLYTHLSQKRLKEVYSKFHPKGR
jgi:site-specific recombinase XerD